MIEADDLYGLPLDEFTPERDALVKALRSSGEREQATRIAALRKPSVAAWAVNQLVRTQGRTVAALFDAGDELQRAQDDLVARRGSAGALREASGRLRAALDELAAAARGLLTSAGRDLTPATLERVYDTLHAAALDEEARELIREGRLERELRHVGLGAVGAVAPAPTPPAQGAKLKAARKAEADAARVLQRAERELREAETRRDRAAVALQQAEEAVSAAREHADEAAAAHRDAQRALERLH